MPSHDLPCSLYGKPSQPLQQPEAQAPKTHKPGKQLSHSQRPLHHPEPLLALMEPKGRAKRGKVMSLSDTSTAQGTGRSAAIAVKTALHVRGWEWERERP